MPFSLAPLSLFSYMQTDAPRPSPTAQTKSISEVYFWHSLDIPWQRKAGSSVGKLHPVVCCVNRSHSPVSRGANCVVLRFSSSHQVWATALFVNISNPLTLMFPRKMEQVHCDFYETGTFSHYNCHWLKGFPWVMDIFLSLISSNNDAPPAYVNTNQKARSIIPLNCLDQWSLVTKLQIFFFQTGPTLMGLYVILIKTWEYFTTCKKHQIYVAWLAANKILFTTDHMGAIRLACL